MKIRMSTARKMMGITQMELKAKLNTSQSTLSKIENDQLLKLEVRAKFIELFEQWRVSECQRLSSIVAEIKSMEIDP